MEPAMLEPEWLWGSHGQTNGMSSEGVVVPPQIFSSMSGSCQLQSYTFGNETKWLWESACSISSPKNVASLRRDPQAAPARSSLMH